MEEALIPKHGGYRKLKTFQLARLVCDLTVWFCGRHVPRASRTRDRMVQAARPGVQNIAEGSQASETSKKTELKLTNVARAGLEELRLDYEDFLRQHGLELPAPDHPALRRFKARRCSTLAGVQAWLKEEPGQTRTACPCQSESALAAKGALSLLNLCCFLLDRQLATQAAAFEREGGFTEGLFRLRTERRKAQP